MGIYEDIKELAENSSIYMATISGRVITWLENPNCPLTEEKEIEEKEIEEEPYNRHNEAFSLYFKSDKIRAVSDLFKDWNKELDESTEIYEQLVCESEIENVKR